MGSHLDKPVVEKDTDNNELHGGLLYSASAMQGWRVNMEVRSSSIRTLCASPAPSSPPRPASSAELDRCSAQDSHYGGVITIAGQPASLVCVFDGHGGDLVAIEA